MGFSTLARIAARAANHIVHRPITAPVGPRAAAAIFGQHRMPVRFYADDTSAIEAHEIRHQEVRSNMINHAYDPKQVRSTCSWLAEFKPRYDASGNSLEQRPEDAEASFEVNEVGAKVEVWKNIYDRKRSLNGLIVPAIAINKKPLNVMYIRNLNWLQRYKEENQKLTALHEEVVKNLPEGKFKDKALIKLDTRFTQLRHHWDIESDRYVEIVKLQKDKYANFHDHEQISLTRPLTIEPADDYDGPHTNS